MVELSSQLAKTIVIKVGAELDEEGFAVQSRRVR